MEQKGDPNVPIAVAVATPLVPVTAGKGQWRTSLCSCFEDCYICCAVCCCHQITVGQLYERAAQKAIISRLPMATCMSIAIFLFVLDSSKNVIDTVAGNDDSFSTFLSGAASGNLFNASIWEETENPKPEADAGTRTLLTISEILGAISFFTVLAIVCTVRRAVRTREGIPAECCGDCEDFCCACCCNPCTQCMLLRHEKMGCVGANEYSPCSPTAVPL